VLNTVWKKNRKIPQKNIEKNGLVVDGDGLVPGTRVVEICLQQHNPFSTPGFLARHARNKRY
jgi:hypothetical protein